MNAVGIDVSKGKSMVAALRPMGEVALMPQEFLHTGVGLEQMAYAIIALGEDTRIVMEATGRCHISLTDKTFPGANELFTSPERAEMTRLAMQLPEYDTVRAMYGVGETTAVQLMAEIGDVRRFPRRSSIVGFAGVDPAVNQSGKHSAKSVPTTKRGSPHLRKTLYPSIDRSLFSKQSRILPCDTLKNSIKILRGIKSRFETYLFDTNRGAL